MKKRLKTNEHDGLIGQKSLIRDVWGAITQETIDPFAQDFCHRRGTMIWAGGKSTSGLLLSHFLRPKLGFGHPRLASEEDAYANPEMLEARP
jgi:hypothetical protein